MTTTPQPLLDLSTLESYLWDAANILRNSPLDRTEMLAPQESESVYDPACGTGGMLLAAVEHVKASGGDPRTFFGKLYDRRRTSPPPQSPVICQLHFLT